MDATKAIRGLSPVVPTPFQDNGQLDLVSFERVIHNAVDLGVTSLMFPGFASESRYLADDEKSLLVERLLGVLGPDRRVAAIISVSDHATAVAVRRAREMADLGADAVNLLPPHLGSPPLSAVLEHLAAVFDAVPTTPVVVQYAPTATGQEIDPDALRTLAKSSRNFFAVKVETRPAAPYVRELVSASPSLACLVGNAGVDWLPSLDAGARGVQPGGGFLEIYAAVQRHLDAGDRLGAETLFARLAPYLELWSSARGTMTEIGKLISKRRGLIDSAHCRAPKPPVDPAAARLDDFMAEFSDILPSAQVGQP